MNTEGVSEANVEPIAAPASTQVTSLIELSDSELAEWLTASVLDEFDPLLVELAFENEELSGEIWEQVVQLEAALGERGDDEASALDRAVALLGIKLSCTPELEAGVVASDTASTAQTLGELQLLEFQSELSNRAERAVMVWSSWQGSAVRAASLGRS